MDKEKLKKIKAGRLREARVNAGFKSLPDAVRHHKWNENTYKPHETGSREFDNLTAVEYAIAFKVPLEFLLALDELDPKMRPARDESDDAIDLAPQPLAIHGEAAGGLWREGDDVPLDDSTNVPADPNYPASIQYARKVVGNSVSRRIPDGEYAVILHYDRSPVRLQAGRLVDVERVRAGMREHTIKVYAEGDRLVTDSADLDEQVELDMAHTDEDTTVRIVGIVVGKYRPLI